MVCEIRENASCHISQKAHTLSRKGWYHEKYVNDVSGL